MQAKYEIGIAHTNYEIKSNGNFQAYTLSFGYKFGNKK